MRNSMRGPETCRGRGNNTRVARGGRVCGKAILLNACDFPPFAYRRPDLRRGMRCRYSIQIERTPPREWSEVCLVLAPDSNRLHSVLQTDALPNELACDFRP